jgi:hypothetical protein
MQAHSARHFNDCTDRVRDAGFGPRRKPRPRVKRLAGHKHPNGFRPPMEKTFRQVQYEMRMHAMAQRLPLILSTLPSSQITNFEFLSSPAHDCIDEDDAIGFGSLDGRFGRQLMGGDRPNAWKLQRLDANRNLLPDAVVAAKRVAIADH